MKLLRLTAISSACCLVLTASAFAENTVAAPAGRASQPSKAKRMHAVKEGETLWAISRIYGCSVDEMKSANKLRTNLIHPGTELEVPRRCGEPTTRVATPAPVESSESESVAVAAAPAPALDGKMSHTVSTGDTLFRIAKRYDTTVDDIAMRNGISGNIIYPGQELEIAPGSGKTGRAIVGQSVGLAHRGRLVNPARLRSGRGYHIRRPKRTFGANHLVHSVRRAVDIVRRRHPKVHAVAIGDISSKKGGRISGHRSHQSGRDVDIGFYFKKRPKRYPKEFALGTNKNLHLPATWTLVSAFANMADAKHGVERIFLSYEMQKILYKYAKKNGVSDKTLRRMFQYPHGRETPHGIIRHEPAHNDHIHVRFKCPEGDKRCR